MAHLGSNASLSDVAFVWYSHAFAVLYLWEYRTRGFVSTKIPENRVMLIAPKS